MLLKRIKENDQKALEDLFDRYYYRLCDFVFQFVRSFDLTEEVVSDVFFKIWKSRHKLDIADNFKSYIYTSTRNQALNYLQKEQRDQVSLDESIVENSFYKSHQDEELIYQELENRIEILINTLPPRRKQIFKLSRLEGFTYKEIAEILSISVYTVQNQMTLGIKQLAAYSIKDDV
ncbi:MAG: RNA polymerase sigma-70 factor [Balneolaceae bacterium]